ncbi:MAG: AarF/ABC1/UbiB kinase family protein [Deltaproteobacteria bacterium]|nr:AarF/ABC1/UbiB kinase family protein [Deltaproteobacteria bacterium]
MSTLRSVYTNLRAARTTIRDVRRFQQIARVLMRHGFGFLFSRFSRADPELKRALEEALEGVEEGVESAPSAATIDLARRARASIEELGPVFVKFGQILSTRPDLVPPVFCRELQGLQDDVGPMSSEQAGEVIRESLGVPASELFAEIDPVPIAAASVAQVHEARLESGERVAVKVQRPRIADTLDADLDILYFLARQVVEVAPEARFFDPVGIVREFEKAVRRELDFAQEARNLIRFARNFEGVEGIHIPRVYREYSSTRVLTMEFVDGRKVQEAIEEGYIEAEVCARELLNALFKQLFQDGFFHGDLHPGNIFVLDDGRICFLDFGLCARLTPERKDRVVDVLFAIGREDYDGLARAFFELGIREAPVDYDAFVADVYDVAERNLMDTPLSEVDVGHLFRELVEGCQRHRMRMPADYTLVFKALMTIEGLGKQIAPDMDVIAEAQPFIQELLRDRYSPERLVRRAMEGVHVAGKLMRQVPPALTRVLEDIDSGRMSLKVELPAVETLVEDRRRSDTLWGLGATFGILTLSATLALGYEGYLIWGFPAVSFVGYLLALPSAVLFLRAWWRR